MGDFQSKQSLKLIKYSTLSRLPQWQAHFCALRRTTNQKKHTIEIFNTSQQTRAAIVVELTADT